MKINFVIFHYSFDRKFKGAVMYSLVMPEDIALKLSLFQKLIMLGA